jgi:hypothetical protein
VSINSPFILSALWVEWVQECSRKNQRRNDNNESKDKMEQKHEQGVQAGQAKGVEICKLGIEQIGKKGQCHHHPYTLGCVCDKVASQGLSAEKPKAWACMGTGDGNQQWLWGHWWNWMLSPEFSHGLHSHPS